MASVSLPVVVLDENQKLVTDPVKVLETWRKYVLKLGKQDIPDRGDSISKQSQFDDEFAWRVRDELRDLTFGALNVVPELDKAITWEEVHSAIVTLGDGKAAAEDGLVNELIRYSGMPGVLAITDLFRFLWDNCVWPEQWQVALLKARVAVLTLLTTVLWRWPLP